MVLDDSGWLRPGDSVGAGSGAEVGVGSGDSISALGMTTATDDSCLTGDWTRGLGRDGDSGALKVKLEMLRRPAKLDEASWGSDLTLCSALIA